MSETIRISGSATETEATAVLLALMSAGDEPERPGGYRQWRRGRLAALRRTGRNGRRGG